MRSSQSEARVSQAAGPDRPGKGRLWSFLIPRRRCYIVNWRYQLRASLFSVCFALVLLTLVNLNVYFTNKAGTESILVVNPELRASLEVKDHGQVVDLALGSAVVILAVFALAIFQTHKTAGAAFSLRRTLCQLRDGRYDSSPRLRRDDNLQELLGPIHDLARALRETNAAEIETLQTVVDRVGRMAADPAGREATSRLLDLIQEKKARIGPAGPSRPGGAGGGTA